MPKLFPCAVLPLGVCISQLKLRFTKSFMSPEKHPVLDAALNMIHLISFG